MRSGGAHRLRPTVAAVATCVAFACAGGAGEALAGEWKTATPVPSTSVNNAATAAGLADDGSAAIAYFGDADVRVATRQGPEGSWSVHEVQESALGASFLSLDMNAAGDVVVGFSINQGSGFAIVAYRPAGGAWEATKYLDSHTLAPSSGGFDVAINSKGDAVAGWVAQESGAPPKRLIRAVARTKSGGWPGSYQTVVSEDILTTKGTQVGALPCGGPAVAVDDGGHALAAWSSPYGSFEEDTTHETVVCGVRQSLWNGASWGSPTDLSPRPAIGWLSKSTTGGPDTGIPVASSDPASGALGLVFRSNPSAFDEGLQFDEGWSTSVLGGSVGGGAGGAVLTPSVGASGDLAVGVTGNRMAVGTWETDSAFDSTYSVSAGLGPAGTGLGLGTIFGEHLYSIAADAGGDGSGFLVSDRVLPAPRKLLAWTAAPGGSYVGPTPLLENATVPPSVAANCHGDAIVSSGGAGGLFHVDYASGETGACGSGPSGGGPSGEGPPAPAPVPKAGDAPSTIKFEETKSTRDGKVIIVFTTPNGGIGVFQGTSKVDSNDLARISKKKMIVVTKKSFSAAAAGTQEVVLAPNGAAKKVIAKKGKLAASVALTFTPTGASPIKATRQVVFKAPKKPKKR